MRQFKVANRYANALFTLALENQQLEAVKKDMGYIRSLDSAELKRILQSPVIRPDKKLSIFKAVFEGKLSNLTLTFFSLIFSKGRSLALDEIQVAFERQYRAHKGIEVVQLTTADPVSPELREEIRAGVEKLDRFKGKSVMMTEKVDPSIVGGFVLQIGDELFDASIRTDLRAIKKQFVENMYIHNIR
jgi:F-type H+-transporting ATPase subunit delta